MTGGPVAHHGLRAAAVAAALAVGALAAATLSGGLSPADAVPTAPSSSTPAVTTGEAPPAAGTTGEAPPAAGTTGDLASSGTVRARQRPGFRAATALGVPPAVDAAAIAAQREAAAAAARARQEARLQAERARQAAERRREARQRRIAAHKELMRQAADMVGVQASLYRGRYFLAADEDVRQCIVRRESEGYYSVVDPSGTWFGAYQFARGTSDVAAQRMGRSDLIGVPANRWNRLDQDTAFWVMWDFGAGRQHWAGGRWAC